MAAVLTVVLATVLSTAACGPSTQNSSSSDLSSSSGPGSTSADGAHTEQTTYLIDQTVAKLTLDGRSGRGTRHAGQRAVVFSSLRPYLGLVRDREGTVSKFVPLGAAPRSSSGDSEDSDSDVDSGRSWSCATCGLVHRVQPQPGRRRVRSPPRLNSPNEG
ncbi:MAG: hypothetical protein QOH45_2872 [Pseudonocardiales bacterium]|nr:hypothetical protein [Pseudonocardiales bacterium]